MCILHSKNSRVINEIEEDTLAPIKLITTRENDPVGILQAKGHTQQPPINILLCLVAYDTVQKRSVPPSSGDEEIIFDELVSLGNFPPICTKLSLRVLDDC